MSRRSGLAVVAVTGAVACAAAARADLVIPTTPPPGPNARIAGEAVSGAIGAVAARDRACGFPLPSSLGSETHDPPPQEMLDAFTVLRRPATPQDQPGDTPPLPTAGKVAVDYVRRARVLPDGTAVYLIPSLDAHSALPRRPARCAVLERTALEHRLRGKPAQAQRAARRLLRDLQRTLRQPTRHVETPGVFVEVSGPYGGAIGGGLDVASIRKYGALVASYAPRRASRVVGLVPDGVATIEFTFARGHGRDPAGDRTVSPRASRASTDRQRYRAVGAVARAG